MDEKYGGPERRAGWHFNKSINLVDLMTILLVSVGAVNYMGKLEQRIALLEASQTASIQRDERFDKALTENMAVMRSMVDRVEAKLDRLVEQRYSKGN